MALISPPPMRLVHHGQTVPLRSGDRVALVGLTGADTAAEDVVRSAFASVGLHRVGVPDADVTVRFGRCAGGPGAYRVAVANREISLDGGDAAGVFYAAQAFARLVGPELSAVTVEDRPAMPFRGSVEGFYGTPWTHRERLSHLDFLGAHRMNTYVYAPKRDPHHRDRWREPYPDDALFELAELVERAGANHVTFVFTVSPGLSIRYRDRDDLAALLAKFEAVRTLGCTAFAVALDDIERRTGPEDERPGLAHAWLVNQVRDWAGGPVQLVPTEYHGVTDSPYKRDLRDSLAPDVHVWWTGRDVVSATITVEEARLAAELFGRRLLVWDNYPVNDYIPGRIPLGPYDGRENGLSAHVDGVLSNPANQAAMSTVALRSFADYGWDDTGFDAADAHRRALDAMAGGRADVRAALAAFADLNTRDDRLHHEQAPWHAGALAAVRAHWAAGDRGAALARLTELANQLIAVPALVGAADARFAVEADAWLAATRLWGWALAALVPVLEDGVGKDRVRALMSAARAVRDDRSPHRTVGVLVGDGVLDEFLTEMLDAS
jgi:hyaluronoglucosaminidase